MNSFLFEGINVHFPDDFLEMRNVFDNLLSDRNSKYISFINPEIMMQQQKDNLLHDYFVNSRFNFIDGVGLLYAINKKLNMKYSVKNRFPGTDFFEYLPKKEIKFFLYGSKPGIPELAKQRIEKKYDNISIVGFFDGYTEIDNDKLVNSINSSNADVLVVCTGCPKQEKWIKDNIKKLKIPLVFGNGGAIDFWSGSVSRAPSYMINHGFEWLYRLSQDFSIKRISRQIKLIKFFINYKFKKYHIEKIL